MGRVLSPIFFAGALWLPVCVSEAANRDAETYVEAVAAINESHAKRPGETAESALAEKLPRAAVAALMKLIEEESSADTVAALVECGQAALDLALIDHFRMVRQRLLELAPDEAAKLGDAIARERFVVIGVGALQEGYLDGFADVTDAILDAYDEVFGFAEWSKVPGKKIRIRVHLVDRITRPPHFAPQFPYHSEIDMPVVDPQAFRSPTAQGQMMFYGLCHELGHLIAMWGDRHSMEDHHAWAHYTGVVIVEHMAKDAKYEQVLTSLRDVRWRSLTVERDKAENRVEPGTGDRAAVMALLIKLHEVAGPAAIGGALNHMDERDAGHRINRVRYYSFGDLEKALGAIIDDRDVRKAVAEVFP